MRVTDKDRIEKLNTIMKKYGSLKFYNNARYRANLKMLIARCMIEDEVAIPPKEVDRRTDEELEIFVKALYRVMFMRIKYMIEDELKKLGYEQENPK